MDKVFGSNILQVLPTADGLLIAYYSEISEIQATVAFKRIVFSTGVVSNVPKGFFMIAKFGTEYKKFEEQVGNYITCRVIELANGNTLVYEKNGNAKIFDENIKPVWSGAFKYKECPITSADLTRKTLWASYTSEDSIIRYNLSTMREELRLGGANSPLQGPKGIFIEGNEMIVCSSKTNKLFKVNLSSYAITEYMSFKERVHEYFLIGGYEFVLLDSGLYLI